VKTNLTFPQVEYSLLRGLNQEGAGTIRGASSPQGLLVWPQ